MSSDAGPSRETGPQPLPAELLRHPQTWKLWAAVAAARRIRNGAGGAAPRLVYRSRPSLRFVPAEVEEIAARGERIELTLGAPGPASPGSALPASDIERIARTPPLADWLDGALDRFMQAVEDARVRSSEAFALARGGESEALRQVAFLAGRSAPLAASPASGLTCSVLARGAAALWGVVHRGTHRDGPRRAPAGPHRASGRAYARGPGQRFRTSSPRASERRSAGCSGSAFGCPKRASTCSSTERKIPAPSRGGRIRRRGRRSASCWGRTSEGRCRRFGSAFAWTGPRSRPRRSTQAPVSGESACSDGAAGRRCSPLRPDERGGAGPQLRSGVAELSRSRRAVASSRPT